MSLVWKIWKLWGSRGWVRLRWLRRSFIIWIVIIRDLIFFLKKNRDVYRENGMFVSFPESQPLCCSRPVWVYLTSLLLLPVCSLLQSSPGLQNQLVLELLHQPLVCFLRLKRHLFLELLHQSLVRFLRLKKHLFLELLQNPFKRIKYCLWSCSVCGSGCGPGYTIILLDSVNRIIFDGVVCVGLGIGIVIHDLLLSRFQETRVPIPEGLNLLGCGRIINIFWKVSVPLPETCRCNSDKENTNYQRTVDFPKKEKSLNFALSLWRNKKSVLQLTRDPPRQRLCTLTVTQPISEPN